MQNLKLENRKNGRLKDGYDSFSLFAFRFSLRRGFTPFIPKGHQELEISVPSWGRHHRDKIATSGRTGFTIAEIVVVLAVIIGISAMVLVSFSGLNEGAAINRTVRELALALRKTQNMALAVTQIDVGAGPVIPSAVGVRLKKNDSAYFLFADVNPVDNMYNGTTEKITGPDTLLQPRVRINRIYNQDSTEYNIAYILFAAPEATIILTHNEDPSELPPATAVSGDRVSIEFMTTGGQKRTVVIRESGQISIK